MAQSHAARKLFIWMFGELFSGKLPDEFVQIITPRATSANKRRGHQRREHSKRCLCHLLCRLTPEPTAEGRKPKQDFLLFLGEQFPRLVDDGAHGAVTSGKVVRRYAQEIHPA